MDREKLQTFIQAAEADLASVRSGLLIISQTGDASDLAVLRAGLTRLKNDAQKSWQPAISVLAMDCEAAIKSLTSGQNGNSGAAYKALDIVAAIEAALHKIHATPDDLPADLTSFVDASFAGILPKKETPLPEVEYQGFEIDEETLDIFRSEAEELLANIGNALTKLNASPADQNALWEIRRNAHTFKGAAGIVGLTSASVVAHRMEDLLDKMVEARRDASPAVVEFLAASSEELTNTVNGKPSADHSLLDEKYEQVTTWLATGATVQNETVPPVEEPVLSDQAADRDDPVKPAAAPVVRVSLDRLDELLKISRNLAINRSAVVERFAEFSGNAELQTEQAARLKALFEIGRRLTAEMQDKLLRIRMVRFATLETRLARAVHVTCLDENKKAALDLQNPDVEIDTLVIDALIEPLLHLLKNAVVHGIESPETRRLIGKPETGNIRVRIEADDAALVLSVIDDGGGISVSKLKEKAVTNRLIDKETADAMNDRDAVKLIFDRGLTTAGKVDLNAGRGVGMSIVKESIEARGGTVKVDSRPQRGTTFTILMPLSEPSASAGGQFVGSKGSVGLEDGLSNWPPTDAGGSDKTPLVLIVDDSASIRRQTQKLVEDAGMLAITAENGADALELLLNGAHEPDLILSDIEMPQIDGWQFLEYVKTDENLGHIPVVIMTSLEGDEHRTRALDLGATDFLQKPFGGKELETILDHVVGTAVIS